ncbi:MAG: hypothetical protein L6Q97_18285 [Thermoanaerobaculia bacterium]|nr:hypothetical protein [Thermoanaerobaculia bacterium]
MQPNIIPDIKNEARTMAQLALSKSASFQNMSLDEQRSIYLDLVNENIDKLSKQYGLTRSMATNTGPGTNMGFKGIDPGFDKSVDAFEDLVDSVDFPKFVADLLKGVFDANLAVMKTQTDSYIALMKEATKSVADFVKDVNEDDALAKLAEEKPDMYNINMEPTPEGQQKMTLITPQGEKVNMDDNQVKAHVMDTKINMAKENRAAIREVILMGVTRLVVERGTVEAAVEFNITANRMSVENKKVDDTRTSVRRKGFSFGSFSINPGVSTRITVATTTNTKTATDNLAAKLMGKVNIQFKTDYFKLDNFLEMYGGGGIAQLKREGQQQAAPPFPGK